MLASIEWLKDYVDITVAPHELAEKITRVGLEVEGVDELGEGISGVITGKVTHIERHPNSDHLWICMMDYGSGEIVQILTGAQNVHQDDIVPVATVGATLPSGMKLKKAKMRGLDSFGMLCSATELGIDAKLLLPEQREGIFILPPTTPIGLDIKEVLGLNDTVLDIDLTANRGDCTNIIGLAREAAAVLKTSFTMPSLVTAQAAGGNASDMAKVTVEAQDLCSRFAVRILKDIKIMPSPEWMQRRLRACGVRPISNVVDVTNYVMLEMGQPMHAYDYDQVAGKHLIVRRAHEGETLVTLDDVTRELDPSMLVIADEEKAVGLGGVMGGLATEVTAQTTTVMLEAATFEGANIRRTSKALGLRSEASGRFERGVNTAANNDALARAAYLLEQMGACSTVAGVVEDYPVPYAPVTVKVAPATINARIGVDIATAEMVEILTSLSFQVEEEEDVLVVTAPSWRHDVTCDADISEEIARIHSYDSISSHMPSLPLVQGGQAVIEDVKDQIEDYLVANGLDEVMTYSFVHPKMFEKLNLPAGDYRYNAIPLMNPISDEFGVMRTTMVPGLLNTASYNLARQADSVQIFEVGKSFLAKELPLTTFPEEVRTLCVVMSGLRNDLNWTQGKDKVDFYDIKALATGILAQVQVNDYELVAETPAYYHPGKSCQIQANGVTLGYMGQVHPVVANNFDVPEETLVLELLIAPLVATATNVPQYKHLPKFPGITRDIAVVVPTNVTLEELEKVVNAHGGKYLIGVQVFDLYTGKQVAEGCKSLALQLSFRDVERTLTDADVEEAIKKVLEEIASAYAAKLR